MLLAFLQLRCRASPAIVRYTSELEPFTIGDRQVHNYAAISV